MEVDGRWVFFFATFVDVFSIESYESLNGLARGRCIVPLVSTRISFLNTGSPVVHLTMTFACLFVGHGGQGPYTPSEGRRRRQEDAAGTTSILQNGAGVRRRVLCREKMTENRGPRSTTSPGRIYMRGQFVAP